MENMISFLNSNGRDWTQVKLVVLDLPSLKEPFESRRIKLSQLSLPSHATIINAEECKGNTHIQERLTEILSNGGRGIVATKPQSLYIPKLTSTLLKVKVPPVQASSK